MMKYAAILTYYDGSVTGVTIEAETLPEAWKKLVDQIPTGHLQSVQMAEIPTPKHEIT